MIPAFTAALLLSLLFTRATLRGAQQLSLYDSPADARRVHTRPVPRLGGVAIFAAVTGTVLLLQLAAGWWPRLQLPVLPPLLVAAGVLMFLTGLYDDVFPLRPWKKLALQVAAAVLAWSAGLRIEALSLSSDAALPLGALALPLTVLWIVAVANAINLIDGLDGLATGVAVIALLGVTAAAGALGHAPIVLLTMVMLGALVGFLHFNMSPARIFLGDCGSLFIGFAVACLAVLGATRPGGGLMFLVPLALLALPLLDVGIAIGRRWLRGAPVFGADNRHIHHRLLEQGFSHMQAVLVLFTVAAGIGMLGLCLAFAPAGAVGAVALAGGALVLLLVSTGVRRLRYTEFSEAGLVIAGSYSRMRRVIQDQIGARDLCDRLATAGSVDEMDSVLQEAAAGFGFVRMELCRDTGGVDTLIHGRTWKLDYPVTSDGGATVLRIWCMLEVSHRPFGAERVARILAPALQRRLEDLSRAPEAAAAPAPLLMSDGTGR
jgi:UDP-GlcNAc:undecaprenyl-phosphate/decaprenyl-phosphate GlcNAc-1-phosphate transferase